MNREDKSHPLRTVWFVLSILCGGCGLILCLYSFHLVESSAKGMEGIYSQIYGAGGLLMASVLALGGMVLSIVCLWRSDRGDRWSVRSTWSAGVLLFCSLLFLIALLRYLKHEL